MGWKLSFSQSIPWGSHPFTKAKAQFQMMKYSILIITLVRTFGLCFTGYTCLPTSQNYYKLKSGIIHYRFSGNTSAALQNITLYFDDYGKKEVIEFKGLPGGLIENKKMIILDDTEYIMTDTSNRIKANRKKNFSLDNLDMDVLNDQAVDEYGVKKIGETSYLDRACTKYVFNKPEKKLTGEFIVWKNIVLYISIKNNGVFTKSEAFEIESNTQIPPSIFQIPSSIKFLDMTSINNN